MTIFNISKSPKVKTLANCRTLNKGHLVHKKLELNLRIQKAINTIGRLSGGLCRGSHSLLFIFLHFMVEVTEMIAKSWPRLVTSPTNCNEEADFAATSQSALNLNYV